MTFLSFLFQFADGAAFLVLASMGLAVIFGMMGVINLAHGELITLGAYVMVACVRRGVPFLGAVLTAAFATGLVGALIEALVIRRLRGRLQDSVVATWGISLLVTQGLLIAAGPTMPAIGTPFGSVAFGGITVPAYRLVLIGVAACLLLAAWLVYRHTRAGIHARAAVQRPDIAVALGLHVGRVHTTTFAVGAALAGLAGALYAPTMTVVPTMGSAFVIQSFVTVVVGGADVFAGMVPAAAVLALAQTGLAAKYGALIGQIGLLVAVIFVVRLMPRGISGALLRE